MRLKLFRYLLDLRFNAKRFERTDVNGKEDVSFSGKYILNITCALISVIFVYLLRDGFSSSFVSFSSKTLAILIGLFMTAIIFSFNKFYERPTKEELSSEEKLWDIQSYNYSKQFAYITSYNIVLCVFIIVALSFNTLFEKQMSVNFHEFHFNLQQISCTTIWSFIKLSMVAFQRFIVLFWMQKVIYNTLFVVSSMVSFMNEKTKL